MYKVIIFCSYLLINISIFINFNAEYYFKHKHFLLCFSIHKASILLQHKSHAKNAVYPKQMRYKNSRKNARVKQLYFYFILILLLYFILYYLSYIL